MRYFLPAHKDEFNSMKATLKETVEEMKASVHNTVKELKASVESQMSQAVETVTKLKGVNTVVCFRTIECIRIGNRRQYIISLLI